MHGIKKAFFVGLLACGFAAGSALAEELDGAAIYKNPAKGGCVACHGKDAKSPILPIYPKLAGQNAAYALQQIKDIKSGARSNGQSAAMKGVLHMITEEEMAAVTKWIESLD
ncbi:c-type cytochrome [Thiohalomonas denitrificans]|uniref:c-type cytochrome n=1 Tax=Thiohalomonas denitrificans TaxID=415747 RepID=UPI0026EFDFBA|nr:c-type cytochrome [Thiohalomonas denitrificans]